MHAINAAPCSSLLVAITFVCRCRGHRPVGNAYLGRANAFDEQAYAEWVRNAVPRRCQRRRDG
jgi:hypothetical protein